MRRCNAPKQQRETVQQHSVVRPGRLLHCCYDNFGFLSSSCELADEALCKTVEQFHRSGLVCHELRQASSKAEVLGETLHGEALCCRPTSGNLRWSSRRRRVSGTSGDIVGAHHAHRHGQQGFAAKFSTPVTNSRGAQLAGGNRSGRR